VRFFGHYRDEYRRPGDILLDPFPETLTVGQAVTIHPDLDAIGAQLLRHALDDRLVLVAVADECVTRRRGSVLGGSDELILDGRSQRPQQLTVRPFGETEIATDRLTWSDLRH
jgi:hypothetical protein